jgi:hypothetical protein
MKRVNFIVALLFFVVMVSCGTTSKATRSATTEANAEVVTTMLQTRVYKIDFNRGFPIAGPSFAITSPYFVSVIKDRVESYLPYIGRAYNVPYGGGEGLNFDAPITDYKTTQDRKGRQIVTFNARTAEDNYQFRAEIYPSGVTHLTITSTQKQAISFSGNIDLDAEFELIQVAE